jgi:hypothetical protein
MNPESESDSVCQKMPKKLAKTKIFPNASLCCRVLQQQLPMDTTPGDHELSVLSWNLLAQCYVNGNNSCCSVVFVDC